jgi:membrane-associated phospholipid phosphatase
MSTRLAFADPELDTPGMAEGESQKDPDTGGPPPAIERVSGLETRVFRPVNDLPDTMFPFVWLPMQSGSLAAVPIAGVVALASLGRRRAVAIASAGLMAYLLAKGVKSLGGRPRPADLLAHVHVRGARQTGGGYPSGHSAVSAALASAAFPELTASWRIVATSLAIAAPFGRMYVGAHLPLDVVGGSMLGLAVGSLARQLIRLDSGGR